MSHTPGPWAIREPDPLERAKDIAEGVPPEDQELTEVYAEEDGNQVCYVMNDTPAEQANARLIAAAPELLAAVIRMRDEFTGHSACRSQDEAVRMAWDAISKAGGE